MFFWIQNDFKIKLLKTLYAHRENKEVVSIEVPFTTKIFLLFRCLFKRNKIVKLWETAEELIDKECDIVRIIKTVRVMKTIMKG